MTWVDIKFHVKPSEQVAAKIKTKHGGIQVAAGKEALSIQVENDSIIPLLVRWLVKQGESILKINPRDYTLEYIYFALQASEA